MSMENVLLHGRRFLYLLGFALLLCLSAANAWASGPQQACGDPSTAAKDEAQIRRALADWVKAAKAGDWVRAARIWAPDLIGWYPGQPDDTYEREQANARRPRPQNAPRSTPEVTIVEVMVSGDLAVVRDLWKITTVAGKETKVLIIKGFEVWTRQPDGEWRISRWLSAPEPEAK